MKHLKKPAREQRKLILKRKLNPADWMVERDTTTEMVLIHRQFDSVKKVLHKESRYGY